MALETPTDTDPGTLTEWIEVMLLIEPGSLSKTAIRRLLNDEPDADDIEIAFAEITRRHGHIGDSYPFRVSDTATSVSLDQNVEPSIYAFFLLISLSNSLLRRKKKYRLIDAKFDELAGVAMCNYLGEDSKWKRFAFPPTLPPADELPQEGGHGLSSARPFDFPGAIRWLAETLGLPVITEPKDVHKDAGVDIVAWKSFPDSRQGFLTLFGQVTVQENFTSKPQDIVLSRWMKWIDFGPPPVCVLVIPFAVPPGDDRWESVCDSAIMIDRIRACRLIPSDKISTKLAKHIRLINRAILNDAARPDTGSQAKVQRPRKSVRKIHKQNKALTRSQM